tara:strand:+ start:73 stop:297 length:225 start_codon:yes stop_codon:yes gene_type:complete
LYHRYLSLKIEQLLDVFWGMEEQAEIKATNRNKEKFLNLNMLVFNLINNNYKYNTQDISKKITPLEHSTWNNNM